MDIRNIGAAAQQQAAGAKTELASNFDMFLKLLTTQLANQDPLEPTDSSKFTEQLVAYSQVEQQIKSNEQIASLVKLQSNLQLQSGLTYIGMEVRVPDDRFNYKGSGDFTFDYGLPKDAKQCKISVKNEAGDVIFTGNGNTTGNKLHSFTWDGKTTDGEVAPAGKYTIQVSATDEENKAMSAETAVWGLVKGMETTSTGEILLDMEGFGVSIGDVLAARKPKTTI